MSPRHMSLAFLAAVAAAGMVMSLATPAVAATPLPKISVATFNVKDPGSDDFGPWDTRANRSAKVIVDQGINLIGLQELYDSRQDYLNRINNYSNGAPFRMTTDPRCDDSCGNDNRIVYNDNVFDLLGSNAVKYKKQYCPGGDCESPRMFVWARFKHTASGRYIFFITTHLSPSSDSVDVAQWNQLIGWLNAARTANPAYKFIITGDFNVSKFESPASTQLAKMRSNRYEDVLGQIYKSYSTYRNPESRLDSWICSSNQGFRDVRKPNCDVSPGRNSNSIDYIFVSKSLKASFYRVYAQPRTGYVMKYLTSDHLLVRATIYE